MRIYIIIIILMFSIFPHPGGIRAYADSSPTSREVVEELHKLLERERPPENIKIPEPRLQLDTGFSVNPTVFIIFKYIGIILLAVAVILLIVYSISQISFYKKGQIKGPETDNGNNTQLVVTGDITDTGKHYKLAQQLADKGDYNTAIIQLHKGTIAYLIENLFIQENIKYTNRDLKYHTRNEKKIYQPLSFIIQYAEYAAFSATTFSKKEYKLVLNKFEGVFI